MWKYRQHQIDGGQWVLDTIRAHGLAYLVWQERTNKSGAALWAVEESKARTCLIVTKKRALDGWREHLTNLKLTKKYVLTNYESIHKIKGNFDMVILDECHHAIASIGKPSTTWRKVAAYTKGKPIIYLSATPYAETIGQMYHQLKLSDWSPWKKYSTYYKFHEAYGVPKVVYTAYGPRPDRSVFRTDEVYDTIGHLLNFKTRADVGIEHEPTVKVIKVMPSNETVKMIKDWRIRRVLEIGKNVIEGDSDPKMRTVHYQLEGGTLKIDDYTSIFLDSHEKVDHIKKNYDCSKVAIMAHFIKERELLSKLIPEALILSSDGHAEGVDLHEVDKLIVYSMSFKTSKHTQRTARQANHNRKKPIEVDVLVMDKPCVGMAVYDTVAVKKENFVRSSYERAL